MTSLLSPMAAKAYKFNEDGSDEDESQNLERL